MSEEGYSKREIVIMLGVHRDTVTKYIALFKSMKLSYIDLKLKTDSEIDTLFLAREAPPDDRYEHLQSLMPYFEKELGRREMTRIKLWEEYKEANPGGYNLSQFNEYIRQWLKKNDAVMHFEHKAGDKMFVDYAGLRLHLTNRKTGEMKPAEVFVAVLGSSQMTYVEASASQKKEDFIQSVENALIFYEGVPAAIVPDNLKSAVKKSSKYEAEINEEFERFALHYDTAIIPARSRKPRDKSLVENAVKIVYQRIYAALRNRAFFTLDDLNEAILEELEKYNKRKMQGRDHSRYDKFNSIEKKELKPLPDERYELKNHAIATVYKNCHIWLKEDEHYYSVPFKYIGKKVKVIYSQRTVEIYHKYERIAVHKRDFNPYRYSTVKEHMPSAHQFVSDWSPEKFINWASGIGPDVEEYIRKVIAEKQHPEQAYKSCIGILQFAKKCGKERLINACLRGAKFNSYSYKTIKNILARKLDFKAREEKNQYKLPMHENVRGGDYYH